MASRFKKCINVILVFALIGIQPIDAFSRKDYERDEGYYHELCSGAKARDHQDECTGFTEYINEKLADSETLLRRIREQKDTVLEEIEDNNELLEVYQKEILVLKERVTEIQESIRTIEADVVETEAKIEVFEKKIKILEEKVKLNIRASQSSLYVNNYIDFVFGAADFVDLIRRMEGLTRIKQSNDGVVNELIEARKAFDEEKDHLLSQKEQMEAKEASVKKEEHDIKVYQMEVRDLIQSLMAKHQVLEDQSKEVQEKLSFENKLFLDLRNLPNENGFVRPLKSNYWVSTGTWHYAKGGRHMGVDLAHIDARVGMDILAPGSGIITGTQGGCPTYGSYPRGNCNGGWGNYLTMMFSVNGKVYGALFAHLEENSFKMSPGSVVRAGDVIANMGSSGLSSGPHLHLEIYYLGSDSIEAAYDRWDGNITFGTGGANWGNGWEKRCEMNNHDAPCRENPMKLFNYTYEAEY
ncbi:peptidoglycan DD-metalloendopeptidase family protein [Erysipelothrix enhydrae]|uniref:murein hydrolase activator EnvC family protein n=1 Tax=Erysipelothrix enhydrae TaxID=2890314 RepID=UPI002B2525DB|nr:peptidoglycan DD-metalloendopeptidase family protein [Erysipelothrix sp. 4322-04]WRB87294.1 peptidoglycan DD-metalloendopeptidase family protein [Erysipelothrix sp. 4322-04]